MPDFRDAEFILEDGKYVCGWAVEKMSKSMYNVVNPDYIVDNYGADTLRMYEMFLGPLEQSKPWDTNGIDGVHKFLRRFWRLFFDRDGRLLLSDEPATDKELRTLHKTIKKVTDDIENFSFNTSVAAFMICLNELGDCSKRAVLEPLVVLLAPFAPHIAEELWEVLGHSGSVCDAACPEFDARRRLQARQQGAICARIRDHRPGQRQHGDAILPASRGQGHHRQPARHRILHHIRCHRAHTPMAQGRIFRPRSQLLLLAPEHHGHHARGLGKAIRRISRIKTESNHTIMKKTTYIIIALAVLPLILVFLSPFIFLLYAEKEGDRHIALSEIMTQDQTRAFDRVTIGIGSYLGMTDKMNFVVRKGWSLRIIPSW